MSSSPECLPKASKFPQMKEHFTSIHVIHHHVQRAFGFAVLHIADDIIDLVDFGKDFATPPKPFAGGEIKPQIIMQPAQRVCFLVLVRGQPDVTTAYVGQAGSLRGGWLPPLFRCERSVAG